MNLVSRLVRCGEQNVLCEKATSIFFVVKERLAHVSAVHPFYANPLKFNSVYAWKRLCGFRVVLLEASVKLV